MGKRWLIVVGLVVILLVVSFSFLKLNLFETKAFAGAGEVGRYQMAVSSDDVSVLDTTSGQIWLMHRKLSPDGKTDILVYDSVYKIAEP